MDQNPPAMPGNLFGRSDVACCGLAGESLAIDTRLLQILPVAIYMTDADGFITFYNDAAAEFWGRRPELLKDRWSGAHRLYGVDGQPVSHDRGPVAQVLKTGKSVQAEGITERADGTRIHTLAFPHPIRDENGRTVGAINLLTDITERHPERGRTRPHRRDRIVVRRRDPDQDPERTDHILESRPRAISSATKKTK